MHGYMVGRPGGAVITFCAPEDSDVLPPAGQMGMNAIQFYMMEEVMNFAGAVKVQGNVPCIRYAHANGCKVSGIPMLYEPDAIAESIGIESFKDQPAAVEAVKELGRKIAEALETESGTCEGSMPV